MKKVTNNLAVCELDLNILTDSESGIGFILAPACKTTLTCPPRFAKQQYASAQRKRTMRFQTSHAALALVLCLAASAPLTMALSWPLCDPAGLVWMTERPVRADLYPGSNLACRCSRM